LPVPSMRAGITVQSAHAHVFHACCPCCAVRACACTLVSLWHISWYLISCFLPCLLCSTRMRMHSCVALAHLLVPAMPALHAHVRPCLRCHAQPCNGPMRCAYKMQCIGHDHDSALCTPRKVWCLATSNQDMHRCSAVRNMQLRHQHALAVQDPHHAPSSCMPACHSSGTAFNNTATQTGCY
jgi:hypothetical protein